MIINAVGEFYLRYICRKTWDLKQMSVFFDGVSTIPGIKVASCRLHNLTEYGFPRLCSATCMRLTNWALLTFACFLIHLFMFDHYQECWLWRENFKGDSKNIKLPIKPLIFAVNFYSILRYFFSFNIMFSFHFAQLKIEKV